MFLFETKYIQIWSVLNKYWNSNCDNLKHLN